MRARVIRVSLDFKAAALPRLWVKGKGKIDGLTNCLFHSHRLLLEHRRRRTLLQALRIKWILHILWLYNNVVVLVKLIFEIAADSSDGHLWLRLAVGYLPLNEASLAISA